MSEQGPGSSGEQELGIGVPGLGGGENELGAQTSLGMTYIYLPEDDSHFDDDYWATSDLWAPVGTTVDATRLPRKVEGEYSGASPKNEWTGGLVRGNTALAGQHLVGPGGTGLRGRKTWLATPDFLLALGSDVSTQSGADIVTTVEHRNLGANSRRMIVDGRETALFQGSAQWAHLEGVGGYVIADAPRLEADVSTRTGAWSRMKTGASDQLISRSYGTIRIIGGGTHAYAVLPGATVQETVSASMVHPWWIEANSAAVQAVHVGNLLAMNVWSPSRVAGLDIGQPASIIMRRTKGYLEFAVTDPTQRASQVQFEMPGQGITQATGSDRVSIRRQGGRTEVTVDVANLRGQGVVFRLLRSEG